MTEPISTPQVSPTDPAAPPLPPSGQAAIINALSRVMLRAIGTAAIPVGLAAVLVAGVAAGGWGALSAGLGALAAGVASLVTVVAMRVTAHGEPRAVMLASFSSLLFKAIVLMAALFSLGALPWVHRMSLAVSTLVVLIAVTAAEGWAASRMPSFTLDPPISPATSGSTGGRTQLDELGSAASDPTAGVRAESTDHPS